MAWAADLPCHFPASYLFCLFTWPLKILFPTPDIKFSAPILSKSRKTLWKRRSSSWTTLILMLSNTVWVTQRYIHKDISMFEKPCAPLCFNTALNGWKFWRRNPSWIIHKSSFRTAQWTHSASVTKPVCYLSAGTWFRFVMGTAWKTQILQPECRPFLMWSLVVPLRIDMHKGIA